MEIQIRANHSNTARLQCPPLTLLTFLISAYFKGRERETLNEFSTEFLYFDFYCSRRFMINVANGGQTFNLASWSSNSGSVMPRVLLYFCLSVPFFIQKENIHISTFARLNFCFLLDAMSSLFIGKHISSSAQTFPKLREMALEVVPTAPSYASVLSGLPYLRLQQDSSFWFFIL